MRAGVLFTPSVHTCQALSPHAKMPPTLDEAGSYIGHGGDSYGFLSENGHFEDLGVTLSVIANTDLDLSFAHTTFACKAYEVISKVKAGKTVDLGCHDAPQPGAKYKCKSFGHYATCQPDPAASTGYADCLASC